jgi:chaperonin GroES
VVRPESLAALALGNSASGTQTNFAVQYCTAAVASDLHNDGMSITLRPLHDRVLIKRVEEKETVKGGIIIPDTAKEKSQEGEVIAFGTGKRLEDGTIVPLEVKTGDRILFGKYSGAEIQLERQDYIILREDEILGILTPAGKAANSK